MRKSKSTLCPHNLFYRELLLSFIDYLLQEYTRNPGGDPEITKLVGESDLHIIPTMNPDGFEKAEKGDCKGFSRQSGKHRNDKAPKIPEFFYGIVLNPRSV